MTRETIELLQPIVLSVAATILTALGAWVTKLLNDKVGIDVEARHREALHSALMTGAKAAVEAFGKTQDPKAVARMAIEYAQKSVPDALDKLNPSPAVLEKLAASKVAEVEKPNGVT